MKYGNMLILLSSISLSAAEPKTETRENHIAASGEKVLLEEMGALWEKIGPHAKKGSKLAKDNWAMFEVYYRRLAKDLTPEAEEKAHQEIFALMCIPTAYGWPMYRTLRNGIKYTGLVAVRSAGDYEVMVEVAPANSEAMIVLEIDGKALNKPVKPNEKVIVQLKAGVRALSVRTDNDVPLLFGKLHVDHISKK